MIRRSRLISLWVRKSTPQHLRVTGRFKKGKIMSKKIDTLLDYSNGIPFLGKMGYGLGAAAQTTIVTVISAVLTFYYSDVLGINIAAVGTIMLLSRFLDGGSDLIAGAIIDKTKSPRGKCRTWIWRMLIPHFIALILLFTVPKTTEMLQYVYIFLAYNFANTFVNTFAGNAYLSMVTIDDKRSL